MDTFHIRVSQVYLWGITSLRSMIDGRELTNQMILTKRPYYCSRSILTVCWNAKQGLDMGGVSRVTRCRIWFGTSGIACVDDYLGLWIVLE